MSWTSIDDCIADQKAIYGAAGGGVLDHYEKCEAIAAWDLFRHGIEVSLGLGDIPLFEPRLGLPQMVPEAAPTKEELLHEPIIGDSSPQNSGDVQVTFKSWREWFEAGNPLPADWNNYPTPESYPAVAPSIVRTSPAYQEEVESMSLDLGQLANKALDMLIQKELQPSQPQIMSAGIPANLLPALKGIVPGTAAAVGAGELIDYLQGKKKPRRRRKRLATVSDIKDLAALKSVLGSGEAFKTWIATHSR